MKNMLNAMTDFQRIQHMLLGTTSAYQIIRSGLRMQAFLGVFKRAAATATRRQVLQQWSPHECHSSVACVQLSRPL